MLGLRPINLPAVYFLLMTTLASCFGHDRFHGYFYGPPKPDVASILNQQGNTPRNGFEVKLSLPMLNYFNPNVVESIVGVKSEYQPVPIILTKQHVDVGGNVSQKNVDQQGKELNSKATDDKLTKNKDNKNDDDSNETKDINLESTTEYADATTVYDDLSTTEEYTLDNRIAPEVVASLLG